MSARLVAEIAALSRLADFLGEQLLKEAGDAGELRAEVEALKKAAEPEPELPVNVLSGQGMNWDAFNNLELLNQQSSDWNKES